MTQRSSPRLFLVLIFFALLLLTAETWFSFDSTERLHDAQRVVAQSHGFQSKLRKLHLDVLTFSRAAIVASTSASVTAQTEYQDAAAQLPHTLERAKFALADRPRQATDFARIESLLIQHIQRVDDDLSKRLSSGEPADPRRFEEQVVASELTLRSAIEKLDANEAVLVNEYGSRVESSMRLARMSDFAAAAMIFLLIVAIYILARRDITGHVRREFELAHAKELLQHNVDRLRLQSTEIQRLGEMGSLFQACQSVLEIYEVVRLNVPETLPFDSGALFLVIDRKDQLEVQCQWGPRPPGDASFAPEACWALRRGRPRSTRDSDSSPGCKHLGDTERDATLCIPMKARGETMGVLCLCSSRESLEEEDVTIKIATTVADQISLAIVNLRLRDRLLEQSVRDSLTGLFNRRYLEESLERELKRAARHGRPLCIAIGDIDHFRRFNSRFGHDGGDQVLREVSRILRTRIRGDDIACRYGGEEFVLILPEASLESTLARAEEIRREVADLEIDLRGELLDPVTISFGVAAFPTHARTYEDLLQRADQALYRAKEGGRNRVEPADPIEVTHGEDPR